MLQLLKQKN